ncbi:hypothetical protein F2Q68_00006458 [Brassica cretica]|uniref:F-box associated beta-propeller type 3 domain-containing protein n=1 Tax=Brassica cretica TaxID=69181 RepID=A0A8S9JHD0_BRACR|nr:hypothetical protein F2Q68_00006458 [Brassica cretica]
MMRDDRPPALASYHRMLNRSPVAYRPNRSQQQLHSILLEKFFGDPKATKLINYKGKLGGIDLTYNDSDAIELCMWILEDVESKEWSKYVYTLPVNGICEVFVVGVTTTVPKETLSKELKSEVLENTMKLLRLSAQFAPL